MIRRIKEYFKVNKDNKQELDDKLEDIRRGIAEARDSYISMFNVGGYIDISVIRQWMSRYKDIHDKATSYLKDGMIEKKKIPRAYLNVFNMMPVMFSKIYENRDVHNRAVTDKDTAMIDPSFEGVALRAILQQDSIMLIEGPMQAEITDILKAKMKYYTDKGICGQRDMYYVGTCYGSEGSIYALACEMTNLSAKGEYRVDVRKSLLAFLRAQKRTELINKITDFYINYYRDGKTIFSFKTRSEYDRYLRNRKPVSLRGDEVESYEEMETADFLFLNGIDYEYKRPFYIDTEIPGARTRYKPTFTLKEKEVYINIFTADSKKHPFIQEDEDQAANISSFNTYAEYIRGIHENDRHEDAVMLEHYSYEKSDKLLKKQLTSELQGLGIVFNKKSSNDVWDMMVSRDPDIFEYIAEILLPVIELCLSENMSTEEIMAKVRSSGNSRSDMYRLCERLMTLMIPFYEEYTFSRNTVYSVITKASELAENGKVSPYKVIFADNVQNMSSCCVRLLRALIQNGASLICGAVPWIYRPNRYGADDSYLSDFGRYFTNCEFITVNKAKFVNKDIYLRMRSFILRDKSMKDYETYYGTLAGAPFEFIMCEDQEHKKNTVQSLLKDKQSTVLVGRYDSDKPKYAYEASFYTVYDDIPEADNVVLLNCREFNWGFPDHMLSECDITGIFTAKTAKPWTLRERCLLCNILAKARHKVVFLCDKDNISQYVEELRKIDDR